MIFLTPWAAVFAAAISIPLLLLLYFLKLRRRPRHVASTLLWIKSVEDLQVNVPFQRLRMSFLFLLQLLMLILLILALGQPVTDWSGGTSTRTILLIDRSASMNTVVAESRTRLDLAKDAASEIIARLRPGEAARATMIIAFGRTAQVVSGFQTDRRTLNEAIRSIRPTDETADLASALKLADAFSATSEDQPSTLPVVILISDGGVGSRESETAGFSVRANEFRYVSIGRPDTGLVENVGITDISARRDFDDPSLVDVFVRLVNAGTEPIDTTLTLRLGESIQATRRVIVPPAVEANTGELVVTWKVPLTGAGVVTVGQNRDDSLPLDDIASLVMPEPAAPRIVIVAGQNGPDPFVRALVEAIEPADLRSITIGQFESWRETEALGAESPLREVDFVVFDRVTPDSPPQKPTLTFGAVPSPLVARPPTQPGGRRFRSWKRTHRLMRHVELDAIVFSDFGGIEIPQAVRDGATVLATGPDGPVIVALEQRGGRQVVVGFELIRSNWATDVSLLVFMQNVLDAAALGRGAGDGIGHRPGDTITIEPEPGVERLFLRGPASATIEVEGRRRVTLPVLRGVGLYEVEGAAAPNALVAVNLASEGESDIRVRDSVVVNAEPFEASVVSAASPRELWPWLLAAALGLLVLEWLLYARRVRA